MVVVRGLLTINRSRRWYTRTIKRCSLVPRTEVVEGRIECEAYETELPPSGILHAQDKAKTRTR